LPISNTHRPHTNCFSSIFLNAEEFKKRNKDVIRKLYKRPNIDKYREPWHFKGHGSILPAGNVSRYVKVQGTATAPITPTKTSLITTVKENSVFMSIETESALK
jgi:hypothetical protein